MFLIVKLGVVSIDLFIGLVFVHHQAITWTNVTQLFDIYASSDLKDNASVSCRA